MTDDDGGRKLLATCVAGAVLVGTSLAAVRALRARLNRMQSIFPVENGREEGKRTRVMVLTSHPDDETYFFGPTMQALRATGAETHVVCLSSGSAGGDGETRKRELLEVKEVFDFDNLCVVETEDLQDGMDREWPAKTVMAVLDAYTEAAPVDVVVTFDGAGVSGHANHIATHEGAKQWLEQRKSDSLRLARGDEDEDARPVPQVWVLETTNRARKFCGVMDIFTSYCETLLDPRRILVPSSSPREIMKAAQLHKSQFVWYRKLFIVFSRYTYMNTLQRVD